MLEQQTGKSSVEIGLGLLSIGRRWGYKPQPIPTFEQAENLLATALKLGIRYFDTAPSYGDSEEKLGKYLRQLEAPVRSEIKIATKFGEHWDEVAACPFVDQSYDALVASLDRSIERLGRIDVLQLHKTSLESLHSKDVTRAFRYASDLGISIFGVSAATSEIALSALENEWVSLLQFPFNRANQAFSKVLDAAYERSITVVVNRPFGEGRLLYTNDGGLRGYDDIVASLKFVTSSIRKGIVLIGTTSDTHLRQDVGAFGEVTAFRTNQSEA